METVKKDFEKAATVYKSNCDDYKYAKSCAKYGTYMLLGKGVRHSDYKTAYDYFDKGCELKNNAACLHQGLLCICDNEDKRLVRDVAKVSTYSKENVKKKVDCSFLHRACPY